MAQRFTPAEWTKIHNLIDARGESFGLPPRRPGSIVIGSFNIRKLGAVASKSAGAWTTFAKIAERYDLLAIQEVQDDLEGLRHIKAALGDKYGMVVSDITGSYPGQSPPPERLAFLFRWDRIQRTEVASDISYDRASVIDTLFTEREAFWISFRAFAKDLEDWEKKAAERKAAGKKAPAKPVPHLPDFVTFIRQPLCVSFEVPGKAGAKPYQFLAVDAHLLYGKFKDERFKEFLAIVGWLIDRAKHADRMYYPNVVLLGDCNLDFSNPATSRNIIDAFLKTRNETTLKGRHAKLNFPFLSVHPNQADVFRTNARLTETFDQIGLVVHDQRFPTSDQNAEAGKNGPDGYDYGVFNFVELFSQAIHGKAYTSLTKSQAAALIKKFEHDLTDHMPLWMRLPLPS